MLRFLAPLLALLALVLACVGGQTGGELEANATQAGGADCEEHPEPIGNLQAKTQLGFAPADLLAFAVGTHSAPLMWHEAQAFTFDGARPVGVSPESGASEIRVEISHTSGQARYVHSSEKPRTGNGPFTLQAVDCDDSVEVDVDVTITTAGGALSERLSGTLKAKTGFLAELQVSLDLDALTGILELSLPSDVENPVVQVGVSAQFGPEGFFSGAISGSLQQRHDDGAVSSASPLDLANWGEKPCHYDEIPVALGTSVAGSSPQTLFDIVNDAEPSILTWADGTQTSLSLSIGTEQAFVCLYLQGETQRLNVEGTLNAATADQHLDTELGGVVVFGTLDANGALQKVQVIFHAYFAKDVPSAQFEQVYGIHGIDVTDYTSIMLSFQSTYEPPFQRASSGTLVVLGLPDCPPPTLPKPNPSSSAPLVTSPGCDKLDESTVLTTATW